MELLMAHGADPLVVDDDGVTALMSAASQGMRDATAFLLAVPGAELDRAAHSGGTPLMFAAAGGHLETLRLLIDAGGDVNAGSPARGLRAARRRARRSGADGASADFEAPISAGVRSPRPMLGRAIVAAQGGHLACVSLLLDAGADVRAVDEEGMSAANAAQKNHGDAAYELVARGADPDDAGFVDDDAVAHNLLWDAVAAGNEAFAALLVAKGAACGAADARGSTALVNAAHKGLNATVDALLAGGADPAARNDEGVDALIAAASEGHGAVVDSLVAALAAAGAGLGGADKDGTTALMAAAVRGHGAVKTPRPRKAVGGAPGGGSAVAADSNLEVIAAALAGHEAIVAKLLAAGADPASDNEGHAADFDYKAPTTSPRPGPGTPSKPRPARVSDGARARPRRRRPLLAALRGELGEPPFFGDRARRDARRAPPGRRTPRPRAAAPAARRPAARRPAARRPAAARRRPAAARRQRRMKSTCGSSAAPRRRAVAGGAGAPGAWRARPRRPSPP
ncbi:hypothetical protein JL720_17329 [Aureococcus anophagefferens]|nr:hypothetical protein JL720_17329 [Aureococcus anophagefferens]